MSCVYMLMASQKFPAVFIMKNPTTMLRHHVAMETQRCQIKLGIKLEQRLSMK